jgi:hypothetical protein
MHPTGFERAAQRLAWSEQALLADDLVEGTRAHAFGQGFQIVRIAAEQLRGMGCFASFHRPMIGHPT